MKMAANRGAKGNKSQTDIQQKLSSIGENMQCSSSSLLSETKVLNKLIYKSKNTHNKEKFFKCIERINKCLNKHKLLCLDKKIILTSKNVSETENLVKILNEVMQGGQLAIRVIILCQETAQYHLAYLSQGFFVTLHTTLLSLVSRIWVLQKDCWRNLVECFQLVKSLLRLTENHVNLSEFPECLELWLSEDVEKIFNPRDTKVMDPLSSLRSTNPFFKQWLQENNGIDSPRLLEDRANASEPEELDLGEPVEDMRRLPFSGTDHDTLTPGLIRDGTVSGLRTNLTLKFDLERYSCKTENDPERATRNMLRENEDCSRPEPIIKIVEGLNDQRTLETGWPQVEHGKRKSRCNFYRSRKSGKKLVVIRRGKKLNSNENNFFMKITPRRFTVRSLLATTDFTQLPSKKLAFLWKCVKFILHLREGLVRERRVVLRIRDSLRKELRKRKTSQDDVFSFPKNTSTREADKISWKKMTKPGRSDVFFCQNDKQSATTSRHKVSDEAIKRVDEKKANLRDGEDEIDDIFSKMDL